MNEDQKAIVRKTISDEGLSAMRVEVETAIGVLQDELDQRKAARRVVTSPPAVRIET